MLKYIYKKKTNKNIKDEIMKEKEVIYCFMNREALVSL